MNAWLSVNVNYKLGLAHNRIDIFNMLACDLGHVAIDVLWQLTDEFVCVSLWKLYFLDEVGLKERAVGLHCYFFDINYFLRTIIKHEHCSYILVRSFLYLQSHVYVVVTQKNEHVSRLLRTTNDNYSSLLCRGDPLTHTHNTQFVGRSKQTVF